MSDEFVWLKFPETGGAQAFPADSVPNWKARGWVETDEPVVLPIWKDQPPEPEAGVVDAQEELARAEAEVIAAQERLNAARQAASGGKDDGGSASDGPRADASPALPEGQPTDKPVKSTSARPAATNGKE